MKLYFYVLLNGSLQVRGYKAVKSYKSYDLLEKADSYYGTMVLERDIGVLRNGWCDLLILTEQDTTKARQIYTDSINRLIDNKQEEITVKEKEIAELKNKLKIVQSFKGLCPK